MEDIYDACKNLMKVNEISQVTAEILISIGIETLNDLANADPDVLFEKISKLKNEGIIKSGNSIEYIRKWIENAKLPHLQYSIANTRYDDLKARSFNEAIRIILYYHLVIENNPEIIPGLISFEVKEEMKSCFKKSFTNMKMVRKNNAICRNWERNNVEIIYELKKMHSVYFEELFPIEKFRLKYGKDEDIRRCHYCTISESQIKHLIEHGEIITKRIYSRGRTMEVDRTDPNGKYEQLNTELCCYWCNNAKTDEFNEDEFRPVGEAIKKIWENRLKLITDNHDN
ncbi:MAG: DUF4332 domain-containing protein [Bacteroidota bacterium]